MNDDRLLKEREVCELLGVSRSFLAKGRAYGVIPGHTPVPKHIKIGTMIRYRMGDLRAWIEQYHNGKGRTS